MSWPTEKDLPVIQWSRETRSWGQILQRIMANIEIDPHSQCWIWKGATKGDEEYGRIYFCDRSFHVHNLLYRLLVGPMPEGLVPDHLCRVRLCANPNHLEPVTDAVNIHRGNAPGIVAHRNGTCLHGHVMDESNARLYRGRKVCRACERDRHRRRSGHAVVE